MWNITLKDEEDISQKKFQLLCENYKHEAFEISKYAVASGNKSNESVLILDFTIKFLQYAKNSEPSFLLLYVYGNSSNITIFNATNGNLIVEFFNGTKNIYNGDWNSIDDYSFAILTSTSDIKNITINNEKINKTYEIVKDERFYFIALEEKEDERYVCE